jgi:hypothetical protein
MTKAALILSIVLGLLALTKVAAMPPGHSTRQAAHGGGSASLGLLAPGPDN